MWLLKKPWGSPKEIWLIYYSLCLMREAGIRFISFSVFQFIFENFDRGREVYQFVDLIRGTRELTQIKCFSFASLNNFTLSDTVRNGLSIILCECESHRGNASPKMTCSGKHGVFQGIFSKIQQYHLKMFQLFWTYLCLNWRILGNAFQLMWHYLENTES